MDLGFVRENLLGLPVSNVETQALNLALVLSPFSHLIGLSPWGLKKEGDFREARWNVGVML